MRAPLPRWVAPVLLVVAAGLGPWTLYLTYSLPERHVAHHYRLAWIGFDIALAGSFAFTGRCAIRASHWLVPAATVTATMLLCDAWFDTITASGASEQVDAILEACLAELPLAAVCFYVVWDTERFLQALLRRPRNVLEQP